MSTPIDEIVEHAELEFWQALRGSPTLDQDDVDDAMRLIAQHARDEIDAMTRVEDLAGEVQVEGPAALRADFMRAARIIP